MSEEVSGLPAEVVVASNRAAAGVYEDETGPMIVTELTKLGFEVAEPVVVPDGGPVGEAIRSRRRPGRAPGLTTGGTGITPTDRTPEVTLELLDFQIPGIPEALRAYGVSRNVHAAVLSRGVAGVVGQLPGHQPARLARGSARRVRGAPARAGARGRTGRRERPLSPRPRGLAGSPSAPAATPSRDAAAAADVRRRAPGARPGSATPPGWCGGTRRCRRARDPRATTFRALVRRLRAAARHGTTYPFAVEVDGTFAGQLTINNIVRGSAQFASVGYWLDREFAGRGVMPRAVAMAIDHCFTDGGLHRVEVCIRPENSNSLRVVEKLGIREVGFAPAVPAHRRRLARPPDLRDHQGGGPRGPAPEVRGSLAASENK